MRERRKSTNPKSGAVAIREQLCKREGGGPGLRTVLGNEESHRFGRSRERLEETTARLARKRGGKLKGAVGRRKVNGISINLSLRG